MKIPRRVLLALALLFFSLTRPAMAQDFPTGKVLTIYVGFSAGGAIDLTARVIAKRLSENLGQSVVVENRAGAGGNIAQQVVVSAAPDGTALLLGSIGSLAINPHLMPFSYDPLRALAPITMGVSFPNVLVVNRSLGVKTLAEYIAQAKTQKMDFASSGVGSASHMAGEMFNQRAGLDIVHIPYKGGNPAMIDLLGGRVPAYYATPSSAQAYIKSGQVVALATTGLKRSDMLPDVPTIAESGFPGFNATNWYAFVAPGKTPRPILERWNHELVKALNAPDVRDLLIKNGLTPMPGTRDELARFMASESASWGSVVKERHITLE
jgi:tripartite-type tricarboxylate transporter receptor subunit TctC